MIAVVVGEVADPPNKGDNPAMLRVIIGVVIIFLVARGCACGRSEKPEVAKPPAPAQPRAQLVEQPAQRVRVEEPPADQPPPPPPPAVAVVAYEIVRDRSINLDTVRDVVARIPHPVSEDEIRRIADEIKATGKAHPKTSIFFLLPGMEPDKGAWARALYDPALTVKIIGATIDEEKRIAAAPPPAGKIIGEWHYNLPGGLSHRIAFVRRDGRIFMVKTFMDGSSGEQEITKAGRRYAVKDRPAGDWMEINASGHLEFYDKQGKADTASRTPSSPPIGAEEEVDEEAAPPAARPAVIDGSPDSPATLEGKIEKQRAEIERIEEQKKEAARNDNRDIVRRLTKQLRDEKTNLNRLLREQKTKAEEGN